MRRSPFWIGLWICTLIFRAFYYYDVEQKKKHDNDSQRSTPAYFEHARPSDSQPSDNTYPDQSTNNYQPQPSYNNQTQPPDNYQSQPPVYAYRSASPSSDGNNNNNNTQASPEYTQPATTYAQPPDAQAVQQNQSPNSSGTPSPNSPWAHIPPPPSVPSPWAHVPPPPSMTSPWAH